MDITPQVLKDVKFGESWRGYDREEVDEFLERLGNGVAQLQARLREALARAESAEERAASAGGSGDAEESLRRTLVLAQRTADAAIAEANETATRTVADAEQRASALISDAEARVESMLRDAEEEARRVAEATRAPLFEEIAELERARDLLRGDVTVLEEYLAAERERLHGQLEQLRRLLEEPATLRPEAAPATSGVAAPPPPPPPPIQQAQVAGPRESPPAPPPPPEPPGAERFEAAGATGGSPDAAPFAAMGADEDRPSSQASEPPSPDEIVNELRWADDAPGADGPPGSAEPPRAASTPPLAPPLYDQAGEPTGGPAGGAGEGGPPTQAAEALEPEGDAFLEQLRRAVDEELAGDDEEAMDAFFDHDDDERPPSRFGRRR